MAARKSHFEMWSRNGTVPEGMSRREVILAMKVQRERMRVQEEEIRGLKELVSGLHAELDLERARGGGGE